MRLQGAKDRNIYNDRPSGSYHAEILRLRPLPLPASGCQRLAYLRMVKQHHQSSIKKPVNDYDRQYPARTAAKNTPETKSIHAE